MTKKAAIGVLGASGYTGAELVRLLLRHPRAEISLLTADRRAGLADAGSVFAFLALSLAETRFARRHRLGRSQTRSRILRAAAWHDTDRDQKSARGRAATKVVDLSADFRLTDAEAYARWYGHAHQAPELQSEAVYGLSEHYRRDIKKARLVANPGCYTTSRAAAAHSAPES